MIIFQKLVKLYHQNQIKVFGVHGDKKNDNLIACEEFMHFKLPKMRLIRGI